MHAKSRNERFIRWVIVAVAVSATVLAGALAARGGQPQIGVSTPLLGPNPVTSTQDALYVTKFQNDGGTTLTNAAVLVTLPPGTAFRFADPDVCTAAAPAGDGTITVTCLRGLMPPGAAFEQQIVFSAPLVTAGALAITVTSSLRFNERDNDGNTGPQHTDTAFADPAVTNVVAATRDLLGKCASKHGETLSTQGGATSKQNPQITGAVVPANADLACSPVLLEERPNGSVAGACPLDVTCSSEISITNSPQFSLENPVHLSFLIDGSLFGKAPDPATFTWYKNGIPVPDCNVFQPFLDPCIESRGPNGNKGIALGVRWSGNDPSWQG